MTVLLLAAVWLHLAACVLLTGSASLLLMAGQPRSSAMRQWERQVLAAARWLALVAVASGGAWLAARTAMFEGRPAAALEGQSLVRAMLDTWPGIVWTVRHALLLLLAALLWSGGDTANRWDWLAARSEALLLSLLALVLVGGSGHVVAISAELWPRFADMVHLAGAGIWIGGLPPLAFLLYRASRGTMPDAFAVRAMQRFSRVALATVLALVASGIATAWVLVGGLPGLVGTDHGRLLLAKLAILVPALLLAAASRALLPSLSALSAGGSVAVARRMAWFIALEAGLVLLVLGMAAAMTITTPARHGDPVWPWPVRLPLNTASDIRFAVAAGLGAAVALLLAGAFAWRRRLLAAGILVAAVAGSAAVALPPRLVQAFPTSYARPAVTFHVGSIAEGGRLYGVQCASCHEAAGTDAPAADLTAASTRQRTAGELFWLISHGRPGGGMPAFQGRLEEVERWNLVNYLRAVEAASDPRAIGPEVELESGWLVAPDFTISVGPLSPRTLRDYRGTRLVLLVLYDLPGSAERMTELARRYQTLSVLGVEVVAVPPRSSAGAIAALGTNPPTYFPVVTAGAEDIDTSYHLFAPGASHAEFLIDRQGYIRAIWRSDRTGMPDAAAVQAEVERLNQEKAPPPLPDDHVH